MSLYALVKNGEIIEYRNFEPNVDQSLLAAGKPRWLPVVDNEYDPIAQMRGEMVVEETRILRPARDKTVDEVAEMRAAKDEAIDAEFQRLFRLPINFTVGGQAYDFHADEDALQNIMGVVILINSGVPVPNPRKWTPKDVLIPIDITHAEIVGLGAAIAARKDALFIKKKQKQYALSLLTDPVEIYAIDVTEGWND